MPSTQVSPVKILLDLGIDLCTLSSEEDYLSALKEGAAMLQVGGGNTDGRFKILTDEVRKVRKSRKEADPNFKATKKSFKISKKTISSQKLLNSDKLTPTKGEEGGGGDLVVIKEKVVSIEALLGEQYQLQVDNAKDAKKEVERKRRSLKESLLEGGGKVWEGIKKVGQKVIEPFKNIWNKILGFLGTILFGRAVMKIWDWFSKEENKGKIDSIFKFLKDWWPALLAAYLVFGNGLTRFALGLIAKLGMWGLSLLNKVIPQLLKALMRMKMGNMGGLLGWKGAALVGTGLGIYGIGKMLGKDKVVENETERANTSRTALEQSESTKDLSAGDREALVQGTRLQDAGGPGSLNNMNNQFNDPLGLRGDPLGGVKFNKGGQVPGSGNGDTVPAMLTPGEFVMSKGAVGKWGANTLAGMNAAGGGTNQPNVRMSGGGPISIKPRGISYYSQGGPVSLPSMNFHSPIQYFQGGGGVSRLQELRARTARRIEAGPKVGDKVDIGPMVTKNPKVIVMDAPGTESAAGAASQAQIPPKGNREIPSFDATAFRSPRKMEVLGVSV